MKYRKATLKDVDKIIELLIEDDLGAFRESLLNESAKKKYMNAFNLIDSDPNQFLMIVEKEDNIVGTCHLTIMPSLTYQGTTRMQIEAVIIAKEFRGHSIGEWMLREAISFAKSHNVGLIQLTTDKQRDKAKHFYEKIGFKATHEGMKLKV
jgi:ribosomal protein S18 acetylase RimI-like enzyme